MARFDGAVIVECWSAEEVTRQTFVGQGAFVEAMTAYQWELATSPAERIYLLDGSTGRPLMGVGSGRPVMDWSNATVAFD